MTLWLLYGWTQCECYLYVCKLVLWIVCVKSFKLHHHNWQLCPRMSRLHVIHIKSTELTNFFSSAFISLCYFVYFKPNNITIYTRTNNFQQSHIYINVYFSWLCVGHECVFVYVTHKLPVSVLFFSVYHNFSTHGIFPFIIKGMKSFTRQMEFAW